MQPLQNPEHIRQIQALAQMHARILEECPELTHVGNPVLRQKTEEVTLHEGLETANRLKIVLMKYRKLTGFGRGLAAPQIGESKSVFVTYVDDVLKAYLNPRITHTSKENNLFIESCLSCGNLSADVKRPASIGIEYMNESGDTVHEPANLFLARLLQHELDHLEGIVNLDKAEKGTIEFMTHDPLKQTLREEKSSEKPKFIQPQISL